MNSSMLNLVNTPQIKLEYIYGALIFAYVCFVLYVLNGGSIVIEGNFNQILSWVVAGALTSLMGIVAFFLKRLLDSFERKTEQFQDKLSAHHEQIVKIFEKHDHHGYRITTLEKRADLERK